MRLRRSELSDAGWARAGVHLPKFDIDAMRAETREHPKWVHFGAGNIFRAFPAAVQQGLLERGIEKGGIIVAEGYDAEIIDALFAPNDLLSLLVTLKADGSMEKTVIASVAEALKAEPGTQDYARLREVFRAPSLQLASFTITEKGYALRRGDGALFEDVQADFAQGPDQPRSYMGKVVALGYERYRHGAQPLAFVSMDNCSHNGDKLRDAFTAFAQAWVDTGCADAGFRDYVETKLSFPWTMIDKITPRPDDAVRDSLRADGIECDGRVTAKHTYIAPFVNAEETEWLVIEDRFPNGRPALEEGGIRFATRETVDQVEKMKVCTCLNPLHTALAIFGCLLGYTRICDEMRDADLVHLVERIGYVEGLPVVVDPQIIDPRAFLENVLQVRLPNPFMPDTPQRIATDTSQKLAIRFGETIKAYLREGLDVRTLKGIALTLAGWCRYLQGVDDAGQPFALSPDPLLDALQGKSVREIVSDARIFGVDLYAAGLGETIEALVARMSAGKGAVRAALQELARDARGE